MNGRTRCGPQAVPLRAEPVYDHRMLITLAVAIAVAAVMLAAVLALRRRSAGRGDLLAPPPSLGGRERPPPSTAPPPPGGWPEGAAPIHGLPDHVAEEARQLLARNRKIEAVKLVRAATGCSLEEAVERVELL